MQFRDTNFKRAIKNLFLPEKRDVVVLEPHLGLGDGIVCLALVRELSARYPEKKFYYVCLHRCYQSLAWMFFGLDNVFLFAVNSGRESRQLASFLNAQYWPIGVENVDIKSFDTFFYQQHQVPFDRRWDNSVVIPGPQSDSLYEELNPSHDPYILVCRKESSLVSYSLDIQNIENKKKIEVEPHTNNIYDWYKLALGADEIHTIDTAFVHFVESILYQKQTLPSLFYHLARKSSTEFTRRLPWQVVTYPS